MISTEVVCIYLISRVDTYDVDAPIGPAILLMTGLEKCPKRGDGYAGAVGAGTALPYGDRMMKHFNAWDEKMQDISAAGNT